mmetsp:Transcript_24059/g.67777  ORF Transcript_24059/g.67777 Transcript_24059/m.67777 type:complete len:251 (+) Transcript_24059:301-1053(+)
MDTGSLQCFKLLGGTSYSSGDDGTGMAHAASRRCGHSSDETNDWLVGVSVLLEPFGGFLFGGSANLSDHDDALRLRVVGESLEAINEVGSVERVTADTDACRLAQSSHGRLVDSFVRQGSAAADNSNLAWSVDVTGHDPDLALARLDNSWTVRPDQPRCRLAVQRMLHARHFLLRNSLRDGNDQRNFRLDRVHDGLGAEGRRHVDDGRVRLDLGFGLRDGVEDWQTKMRLPSLLWGHASDHVRAVVDGLL